ncbi:MBL fold metallo-hydrolase [Streptomyces avicenniae]|uniref:MBL fold metallo-hydrolase n=1 Tax=Streptomyces avicenniae TaxID=500153 RepID=UPI00069BADDA|nr:MBL fold metallo-hydrolase [Streptomyces avicenniae]
MAGVGRRGFLRTTVTAGTALAAGGAAAGSVAAAGAPARARTRTSRSGATFSWLGNAGWRVETGGKVLLIDPYLSRYDTGMFTTGFRAGTGLTVAADTVDTHTAGATAVFVTHTHWDHFGDVPHIATRTGARVFGTATAYNLGLAMDVPAGQLTQVRGGEVLDLGGCVVEVVSSLHSRNASWSVLFPGVRLTPPAAPVTVADLPEGDTLAFLVTPADGPSVFFMGGSDFVERNVAGLAPDVATVAIQSSDATHDYVPRLLEALGRPATVVPVHWDNFEVPLTNPPLVPDDATRRRLDDFRAAVRRVAPRSRVVMPEYLTPYGF